MGRGSPAMLLSVAPVRLFARSIPTQKGSKTLALHKNLVKKLRYSYVKPSRDLVNIITIIATNPSASRLCGEIETA